MRQELLEYYERELGYLRQMGGEFSKKYPAIAGRLLLESDRCGDPHVERLLEAFSFLAARIHLRLDDDLPELTAALLDIVYPHYLRPLPAMSIAEFSLDEAQGTSTSGTTIPVGSEVASRRTVDGKPCRFRTSSTVELWPLEVSQCTWRRPEQIPSPARVSESVAVLRILLKSRQDVVFSELPLKQLSFYLAGEKNVVLPLYELLSNNILEILIRDPKAPHEKIVTLGRHELQPGGFSRDDSLLPYDQRSFDGYRLLQEYFSFPEKFLFFTLTGLADITSLNTRDELEILIYLSRFEQPERAQALETGVSATTLRLGCTPIVNLFQQTAEPILVSQTRHEYRVLADAQSQLTKEIFSVESVMATNPSRRSSTSIRPLFEYRSNTPSDAGRVFWKAIRKYSSVDNRLPSDMYLSIVDVDGQMLEPNAEILTVRCTCTNHDLPSRLSFDAPDGDFELDGATVVGRIRALHRPTASYPPPAGKQQVWRLISQLSLNHLSLGEGGLTALQEILRIHNFTGAQHLYKQIDGVTAMQTKRHLALLRDEFGGVTARGLRVELELAEGQFVGGGAYLFSAVLERFFGLYVSMNSFAQLSVRTDIRKGALGEWSPRAGSRILL
jgi:type VI secretion system protein ImpG